MELDQYNRSFDAYLARVEEETEARLNRHRQQSILELTNWLSRHRQEWEFSSKEIISQVQPPTEIHSILPTCPSPTVILNENKLNLEKSHDHTPKIEDSKDVPTVIERSQEIAPPPSKSPLVSQDSEKLPDKSREASSDADEHFSNKNCVKEFLRLQETLERNRQSFADITSNQSLKNELNLFIRTQINTISNSDTNHLNTKAKLLVDLFSGKRVRFQERYIEATSHPKGQIFSMDLAAQTFVTVGTRLVNSVPAIAKGMATVINLIVRCNLPIFQDLIFAHLQEQCPYLIPIYLKTEDQLESDDKHQARMRSMVMIYANILVQGQIGLAWTWLASFLSLKPRAVITATILQAFLQEASKPLSTTYGRQYRKLLAFIKSDYMTMLEDATSKSERQSLIKLNNLLVRL